MLQKQPSAKKLIKLLSANPSTEAEQSTLIFQKVYQESRRR